MVNVRRGPLWAASGGSCPYGDRTHVRPGRPAVGLAVVGLVVPGRVGARGVELAWGHVFTGVLVVCAREYDGNPLCAVWGGAVYARGVEAVWIASGVPGRFRRVGDRVSWGRGVCGVPYLEPRHPVGRGLGMCGAVGASAQGGLFARGACVWVRPTSLLGSLAAPRPLVWWVFVRHAPFWWCVRVNE